MFTNRKDKERIEELEQQVLEYQDEIQNLIESNKYEKQKSIDRKKEVDRLQLDIEKLKTTINELHMSIKFRDEIINNVEVSKNVNVGVIEQILKLKNIGYSFRKISEILNNEKGIKITHTTVKNYYDMYLKNIYYSLES